jgi:hypothetical protein
MEELVEGETTQKATTNPGSPSHHCSFEASLQFSSTMSSYQDAKTPSEESVAESDVPEDPEQEENETKPEHQEEAHKKDHNDADEMTRRLQKLALEQQKKNQYYRLKVIQADTSSHLSSAKTFQELNLPQFLLDAVFAMGFDRLSAIQEEALPRILADPPRNVIGQAQSGSGKTAAFVMGMLYRIKGGCITPTRELAVAIVYCVVTPMAANMTGLKVQLAVAGECFGARTGEKVDAHMVIGTPGKVVDWLKSKAITTTHIKVCVFDEADDMVQVGTDWAILLIIKKMLPVSMFAVFSHLSSPCHCLC